MLMQNFKTAVQLGLTELQLDALKKTLVLFETGRITHLPQKTGTLPNVAVKREFLFYMTWWKQEQDCGTVCCIGGTAELVGNLELYELRHLSDRRPALCQLFFPDSDDPDFWSSITPEHAATALRTYLTEGAVDWHEIVKC